MYLSQLYCHPSTCFSFLFLLEPLLHIRAMFNVYLPHLYNHLSTFPFSILYVYIFWGHSFKLRPCLICTCHTYITIYHHISLLDCLELFLHITIYQGISFFHFACIYILLKKRLVFQIPHETFLHFENQCGGLKCIHVQALSSS